jgi:hypothetical protein
MLGRKAAIFFAECCGIDFLRAIFAFVGVSELFIGTVLK